MVASIIHSKIEDFHPSIHLIQGLRNPGMKNRHWEILSERIQMKVRPTANLTLTHCLELGLQKHVDDITHVAEVAGKEYAIEQVPFKQDSFSKYSLLRSVKLVLGWVMNGVILWNCNIWTELGSLF